MYSEIYENDWNEAKGLLERVKKDDIESAIKKSENNEKLTLKDAAALMSATEDGDFKRLIDASRNVTIRNHGNSVGQIGPLYTTNFCVNDCVICNNRKSNMEIQRKSLSIEEFAQEIECLKELGYNVVELVTGSFHWSTESSRVFLDLINHGKMLLGKRKIISLAFSTDSLDEENYAEFSDENMTLVHWQETYDKEAYKKFVGIGSCTKSDMRKRMDTYERWIKSGGEKFGLGILAGLSDNFEADVLTVISHGRYIERNYSLTPTLLGIPRVQCAYVNGKKSMKMRESVTDMQLLKMVAVYRLFFPKANIVASTREPQNIIEKILYVGGTFTNHICSTDVGGYSKLLENLKRDVKDGGLQKIISEKNQQFYHPDPLPREMEETVKLAEKKVDITKEL